MSTLLTKAIWYPVGEIDRGQFGSVNYDLRQNLTGIISINSKTNIDIKNNTLSIVMKNFHRKTDRGVLVSDTGKIIFNELDQIKIWIKNTNDGIDVESESWGDNTEEPPDDYLMGTFFVTDYSITRDTKKCWVNVTCVDKNYIIFNKLLPFSFTESDGLSAPEMIQKIVRLASQGQNGQFMGTGSDAGATYHIDAKLESEGGYIEDTRKTTYEDGTTNTDTTFPEKTLSKLFKPVHEWVMDLSQIEYTNNTTELIDGPLVYGAPFIFWVDSLNRFHWQYPDRTTSTTLTIGTDNIISSRLTYKTFDTLNMVIYTAGKDLYTTGILGYYFDEASNIAGLKMRFIPFSDIAKEMIRQEIANGNLVTAADGAFTFEGVKYDRSGAVTPYWSSTSYSDDGDYNDSLRDEADSKAYSRAQLVVKGLANARWKGTVTLKGTLTYTPGTLITYTDEVGGIINQIIRVVSVSHSLTKTSWRTTIELTEDEKAIISQSQQ